MSRWRRARNVTLTPSGNTLTIAATGGSGGTGNVIQNSTTLQPNTNFNISGDGTAGGTLSGNVVNAATQFNLGGNRVLTVSGAGQNLNSNTFAGVGAGANTTPDTTTSIGNANAFFGNRAGAANTIGGGNAFFGYQAGAASTMGLTNAFFGASAGQTNTAGNRNAFVGSGAGLFSTTGSNNTFIGTEAGFGNLTGSSNTLLGSGTNVSFSGLSFATAIGAGAVVNTSNTITLGRSNGSDLVAIPGVLFAVGGLTAPGPINANGGLSVTGPINTNGGVTLNDSAIRLRDAGDAHHAIAYERSIDGIRFSAFDRFQWFRTGDNFEQMILQSNGDLTIRGNYFHNSDARYKTAVETLPQALDQVLRLRGVSYHWKPEFNRDPRRQIGLIAQEVEAVLPELVNTDDKGFKSVAYANAVPVLVEAIKEQQQQLDELKAVKTQLNRITNENAELKAQVEQLRQIVCATNPTAPLCQVAR
ncbi:MAG: tail fiber domain-containing protein [Blastocatellia bacterium]